MNSIDSKNEFIRQCYKANFLLFFPVDDSLNIPYDTERKTN